MDIILKALVIVLKSGSFAIPIILKALVLKSGRFAIPIILKALVLKSGRFAIHHFEGFSAKVR